MSEENLNLLEIEKMIYLLRGQRVMRDVDLAKLYGVEVRVLNQAVKRNLERFPEDFMLQPTFSELAGLRSQFVILGGISIRNSVKFVPNFFTENGVAMLSTVLNSEAAIKVNISIMRIFTKLRSFLMMESNLEKRMDKLEQNTNQVFKVVFERLDGLENDVEEIVKPKLSTTRKKIGLK
jgi:tetrahydromethanopterin S-methyltransferase subunit G